MDITLYALLRKYVKESIDNIEDFKSGKSAYEIAVEQGFQGTEQEWLKSLEGQSPHIGENGNWFIGEVDTGYSAMIPDLEKYYNEMNLTALTKDEILNICN